MGINTLKRYYTAVPKSVKYAVLLALFINSIGLLFIFTHYNQDALVAGDGLIYEELAVNLDRGLGFGLFREGEFVQETFRTPGLPLLYVLFLKIGLGFQAYFLALSFFSAVLVPVLGWYLAKNLFDKKAGVIVAYLLAFDPIIWLHNWSFISEIPFLIAALLGAAFVVRAYKENTVFTYNAMIAGIVLACGVYIRPAIFPILVIALLAVFIERTLTRKKNAGVFLFVFGTLFLCLVPWYVHMQQVTGVYALSGTGWRNVYTDYLASIRSLKNDTSFVAEKEALKLYATKTWGLERMEINDPKNSSTFRDYALPEILDNVDTVVKLQSVLFVTYFTHSDYQRKLQKLGMLPMNKNEEGRVSSSRLVLEQGFGAIPEIFNEMKNRYFLPVFERLWTMSLFAFATLGFFVAKSRARFLVLLLLALGYLTSSAIGLGMEGRLRIAILPFYFMLVACGILFAQLQYKNVIKLWKK